MNTQLYIYWPLVQGSQESIPCTSHSCCLLLYPIHQLFQSGRLDRYIKSCGAAVATIANHSMLGSELVSSGMVSLLTAIISHHLETCRLTCTDSKSSLRESQKAMIAFATILLLFPHSQVDGNLGVSPLDLQYCCRLVMGHPPPTPSCEWQVISLTVYFTIV